ncbi:hypothetical protein [Enterococcus sp. DIV1537a]|uniref:hypothetical protein n=1 Tax=Enterococcus sp. DIV1537a TaxID=2774733 RepID=UPI003F689115
MAPVVGQGISVSAQGATDETISVTADTTAIENKVLSPLGESSKEAPQELANGVSEESLPKADATLGSVDESENVTSPITSSSKMITGTLSTKGKTNTPKILRNGEIELEHMEQHRGCLILRASYTLETVNLMRIQNLGKSMQT